MMILKCTLSEAQHSHILSSLQCLTTLRSSGYHWYHLPNQHQHRQREQTIVVASMNTIVDVSFRYRWICFNCFPVNHRKWGVELSKPVYWICDVRFGKQKVLKLIKHTPVLVAISFGGSSSTCSVADALMGDWTPLHSYIRISCNTSSIYIDRLWNKPFLHPCTSWPRNSPVNQVI